MQTQFTDKKELDLKLNLNMFPNYFQPKNFHIVTVIVNIQELGSVVRCLETKDFEKLTWELFLHGCPGQVFNLVCCYVPYAFQRDVTNHYVS